MTNLKKNMKSLEEQIAELRIEFLESLGEKISQMELTVLAFDGKKRSELDLDELLREVHSIKGAGGTYDLQIITDICHLFEDKMIELETFSDPLHEKITNGFLSLLDKLNQVVTLNLGDSSEDSINRQMADIWESAVRMRKAAKRTSVMIVDNSRTVSRLIKEALDGEDLDVDYFTDGYAALGRLVSKPYDILFSGNNLNHLSGAGLISAIKLSANLPDLLTALVVSDKKSVEQIPKNVAPDIVLIKSKNLGRDVVDVIEHHLAEKIAG